MTSRTVDIDGVKMHYLTAGHGAPVILIHGYAETSLMWKPIIPTLAEKFTVIAPDLPGIGDSSIPTDGLDMKSAAIRSVAVSPAISQATTAPDAGVAVGPQYDSTHVYVAAGEL